MLDLDLRTVIVVCAVIGGSMAGVLFSLWRSYPPSIRGLREWAAASAAFSLAAVLFAGRGTIGNVLSMLVANLLLLTGNTLFYLGLERFFGAPSTARWWGGLMAGAVMALVWVVWIQPHYGARVFLMSLFMIGTALAACVLLLRKGRRAPPAWVMVGVMLLWMPVLLTRMVSAWGQQAERNFWETTPVQSLYLLGTAFALLTVTVSLVLLASSRLHREFEYLAMHDSLTQALTRRAIIEACERELDRCRRHHRDMALLMLDIDHFKAINDERGHQVGDEVILDFVARVYGVLRRSDQLGRYGGEEFVVLLPETGPQEAVAVAERIRSRTAAMHLSLPSYTVSIGATVNLPGEDSIDALLKRADTALYQAKAGGRNRVVFV